MPCYVAGTHLTSIKQGLCLRDRGNLASCNHFFLYPQPLPFGCFVMILVCRCPDDDCLPQFACGTRAPCAFHCFTLLGNKRTNSPPPPTHVLSASTKDLQWQTRGINKYMYCLGCLSLLWVAPRSASLTASLHPLVKSLLATYYRHCHLHLKNRHCYLWN